MKFDASTKATELEKGCTRRSTLARPVQFSAFLLSVCLLALFPGTTRAGFPEPGSTFSLGEVKVVDCPHITDAESIRTQIKSMIPYDSLLQFGQFTDPLVINSISDADADSGSSDSPGSVENAKSKTKKTIDYSFTFSISCMPATEQKRFRVTANVIRLLKLRGPISHAQPVMTSTLENSAFIDINSLGSEFISAIKSLFLRLARIPQIELDAQRDLFDFGEDIDRFFILRRNDGSEDGSPFESLPLEDYQIEQIVVEMPPDVASAICQRPADYWAQISCSGGFAKPTEHCDPASRVPFHVHKLLDRKDPPVVREEAGQRQGGARIKFPAASYETTYLIRALAVAHKKTSDGRTRIESTPSYGCVYVRARRFYIGITGRAAGLVVDMVSRRASSDRPPAHVWSQGGVDVEFPWRVKNEALKNAKFGILRLVPILGFTYTSGAYPGPWLDQPNTRPPLALPRTSVSYTTELRGKLQWEFLGAGLSFLWIGASVAMDVGLGAEWLRSEVKPFRNDGLHGVVMLGLGGLAHFRGYWRSAGVAVNFHMGPYLQFRWRMDQATFPSTFPTALDDAPGVPDSQFSLGLSLGIAVSPPSALQR